MFSDIFKQLLQNCNVTAYQMSKDTGISESLISNWKSGRQLPKYDSLNILADYFNVSGDFLLGRTDEMPKQVEKQESQVVKEPTKSRIIPLYMTRASAGTGNWLSDDIPVEWMTIPKTSLTEQADFMLKVRGDSMQPKFFDNDVLLIKKSPSILEGEIGIFILNGDSYVKQMGKGELISLNPVYEPIKLAEYDDIRCAGKVIGTVDFE
ncbi:XRE family transcriptional regulator [Ruminococcus sp.]|jgi:repressor LexA|uniref:XRE family transcriptional regulator n=1 Tax=Ruminococcus sp. TaxID=41978 RepID=UPI00204C51E4|nr:MAG TPA: Repressor protein CI [Caudoviricetes sp.]